MHKNRVFLVTKEKEVEQIELETIQQRDTAENALPKFEERNLYEETMRIPLLIMKCIGLYHKKSDPFWHKIYPILTLISLWALFLKTFPVFRGESSFSAALIIKVVSISWSFSITLLSTILFLNREKANRETNLIEQLNVLLNYEFDAKLLRRLRIKLVIINIIFLLFSLANCVILVVSLFGPKELFSAFSIMLSPFHNEKWAQESVPLKLFMALLGFICSIYWSMTVATYLNHSLILDNILVNFNHKFKKFVQSSVIASFDSEDIDKTFSLTCDQSIYNKEKDEKKVVCEYVFEKHRIWHLKICSAIRQADKCYSEFIALTLIIYITISFPLIYVMSNWSGNCITGILQFAYPYWLIAAILILAIILWSSSRINSLVSFEIMLVFHFKVFFIYLISCTISGARNY